VIEHRTIYDEVIIHINICNTWMGKTTTIMPHNCFSKRSYGFNSSGRIMEVLKSLKY
jgi:hypothetical protein